MEPNALDVIEDIESGSFAFGNLLCFGPGGLFVDPAEIAVLQVHPSNPRIILRNGTVVTLSNHGAVSIANIIMQQRKGRHT